jgi:hypothetical protein
MPRFGSFLSQKARMPGYFSCIRAGSMLYYVLQKRDEKGSSLSSKVPARESVSPAESTPAEKKRRSSLWSGAAEPDAVGRDGRRR